MIARRAQAERKEVRRAIVVFALALLLPFVPARLHAQAGGGTVNTTAELLPPPVTGTGMQELKFGSVRPGDVVDVPPGPAAPGAPVSSAGWHFGNIRKGHWVALDLTLPPTLTRGAYSIPIDWNNAGYGLLCVAGSSGVCQITGSFNPGAMPFLYFQLSNALAGTNFDVRLFAGAKITVPAALPPGVYSGTVVAYFAYVT